MAVFLGYEKERNIMKFHVSCKFIKMFLNRSNGYCQTFGNVVVLKTMCSTLSNAIRRLISFEVAWTFSLKTSSGWQANEILTTALSIYCAH